MPREVTVRYRFTEEENRVAGKTALRVLHDSPLRWTVWLLLLCIPILALTAFISGEIRPISIYVVAGALAFVLLLRYYVLWRARRQFRKNPVRDKEIAFTFTEEFIEIHSEISEGRERWAVIVRAVKARAGYLLFLSSGLFYWVPAHTLAEPADRGAFESLVMDKVSDYREVPK